MQVYIYNIYSNSKLNYLSNKDPVLTVISILISINCALIYAKIKILNM